MKITAKAYPSGDSKVYSYEVIDIENPTDNADGQSNNPSGQREQYSTSSPHSSTDKGTTTFPNDQTISQKYDAAKKEYAQKAVNSIVYGTKKPSKADLETLHDLEDDVRLHAAVPPTPPPKKPQFTNYNGGTLKKLGAKWNVDGNTDKLTDYEKISVYLQAKDIVESKEWNKAHFTKKIFSLPLPHFYPH